MANIYFGAFVPTVALTENWNTVSNWYSNPGYTCGSCGDLVGTPAGRLPTTADTVVIVSRMSIPYSGGNWSGPIYAAAGGDLAAGTYSGTVTQQGTISGGTFNGPIRYYSAFAITGGTFNNNFNADTSNAPLLVGGTAIINGTITTGVGSHIDISGGVFNTPIPNSFSQYRLSGGTFSSNLTLGDGTKFLYVQLNAGLVLSTPLVINAQYYEYNSSQGKNIGGYVNITGGTYTGLITLNRSPYATTSITGGSYSPPAVTTPAIKSGNYMTFSSSAIPTDLGFKAAGGTFNPTVQLSGTSNEILGAGLV